ncbi:MAG: RbsD/FucU family protein [Prevotellaceae bacterium]|jgi:L-fucose mutarotase|nr:RbsD/FucU family protein [Prevotellaceae bacterium]MDR2382673.1 RbsD/FucU family protein [Prevotellaceae bacterium]
MLLTKCIHPQLLSALGKLGHGSWILISDGGYPHLTASNPYSEKVFLNLAQGVLTVTQILEVLKETVPIEAAAVMTPPDGAMQPVFAEYKSVIPDTPFEYIKQFDFYERAKETNVGLLIASGDMRNFANLLIKVGFIRHAEGSGNY